jgi:hypothetical protein
MQIEFFSRCLDEWSVGDDNNIEHNSGATFLQSSKRKRQINLKKNSQLLTLSPIWIGEKLLKKDASYFRRAAATTTSERYNFTDGKSYHCDY